MLDCSCADEIVAKLLLRSRDDGAPSRDRYVFFRGMHETHLEVIEAVLEHRALALVVRIRDGWPELLGQVDDDERRHWERGAFRRPLRRGLASRRRWRVATGHAEPSSTGCGVDVS